MCPNVAECKTYFDHIEFEQDIKHTTDVSVPTRYRLGYGLVVFIT